MNIFNQKSHHSDSQLDLVKQKFTINVTLLGTSLMLVYIVIYIYIEAILSAITCIFALTVLVPGIFILIAKNKIYLARLLCVVTTVLVVAISSIGLRNLANVEYYFLQSMMLSLLLFESHQKNSLAFTLFLPIFAWICTKVILPYYEFNTWLISTNFKYFEYLAVFNFIGAFFLTYMFLKFYSNSMYKSKNIEIKNEHNLMQTSKMVSLGQLASGIAHEINNPLSIIIGRTQLLKNKLDQYNETNFDPNFCQQSLDKIENTAALIAKIVKGLNAFSRNSDHDPMQSQSIVKIINSALDLCIEKLKQEKIKTQLSYRQDIFFHCREVQIIQILVNLISNSIDAIEKLEERWIIIDSTHDKNWIYVSVSDSGLGINAKIREKIMLPFFSTKEVGKGIGLGLSISNSIAETHQGSLYYDTRSAHTKFTLKLPLNLRPN